MRIMISLGGEAMGLGDWRESKLCAQLTERGALGFALGLEAGQHPGLSLEVRTAIHDGKSVVLVREESGACLVKPLPASPRVSIHVPDQHHGFNGLLVALPEVLA